MAVMHYVCADCGNAVQEIKVSRLYRLGLEGDVTVDDQQIGEYCDYCNNWNPEVVIAYR